MTPRKKPRKEWIAPPVGPVWVVRWVALSGQQCKHKVYFSAYHARRMHETLLRHGYTAHLYSSDTKWRPATGPA